MKPQFHRYETFCSASGRTIRSCWCSRICGSRWSMCLAAVRRIICFWCWLHGTWRGSEKFSAGTLALFAKKAYFCNPFARQGRSSVGSERLSHIQEVIGSTPIVPTERGCILRLFQGIHPLFLYFFEEGTAAAIYDMRRLQYGRCGELREKALLAPECCLPGLCMMVTL